MLGEIGEAAARLRFLNIGFQFDGRSRLEAGIDGIAEVMDNGRPMARMIAVQVKATDSRKYMAEDDRGFSYLLRSKDLDYWRGSNLPVIVVLYRKSDESFYWKEVPSGFTEGERRLQFSKESDILDRDAVDRLASLTVPKAGFGYYVPPLGGGEEALVNILPVILPQEIFVATTPQTGAKATAILLDGDEPARFVGKGASQEAAAEVRLPEKIALVLDGAKVDAEFFPGLGPPLFVEGAGRDDEDEPGILEPGPGEAAKGLAKALLPGEHGAGQEGGTREVLALVGSELEHGNRDGKEPLMGADLR